MSDEQKETESKAVAQREINNNWLKIIQRTILSVAVPVLVLLASSVFYAFTDHSSLAALTLEFKVFGAQMTSSVKEVASSVTVLHDQMVQQDFSQQKQNMLLEQRIADLEHNKTRK